ncbi:MAG: hypothetical protein ACYTKD_06490 [Planctomycetota bacterium]|jgi:hypothetical protein
MGFAILWLSALAAAALLVALALAQGTRMRHGRLATGLPFIAALVPFALGAVASVVAEQLHSQGLRPSYLVYALSWTTAFVIAAACVIHFGSRRVPESAPMPASRWPRGVIAGALGACIAIHVGTLLYMDARVRRNLEEVKAEAVRMAESVAPTPVPDDRNAALVYEEAFEMMGEWNEETRPTWSWLGRLATDRDADVTTEKVTEFLQEKGRVLTLLRKAASMPDYCFETQFLPIRSDVRIPDLLTHRNAVNLLSLDARHRAAKGDMRGALGSVAASWRMAGNVAGTPILLNCMIAVSLDATGSRPVQDILASGPVHRTDLRGFPLGPDSSLAEAHTRVWKMESAIVQYTVAQPYTVEVQNGTYSTPSGMLWRVFIAPGFLAWCRPRMTLAQEVVSRPYHLSRKRCDRIEEGLVVEEGVLATFPIVSLRHVKSMSLAVASAAATHRLAVLGIATACFRTEEGRYPEDLSELVPGYISAVPIDPFDGKPLKMVPKGDGVVLYTVGPDYRDNGGVDSLWSTGSGGWRDGEDKSLRLGDAYTSALAKAKSRPRRRRTRKRKR